MNADMTKELIECRADGGVRKDLTGRTLRQWYDSPDRWRVLSLMSFTVGRMYPRLMQGLLPYPAMNDFDADELRRRVPWPMVLAASHRQLLHHRTRIQLKGACCHWCWVRMDGEPDAAVDRTERRGLLKIRPIKGVA